MSVLEIIKLVMFAATKAPQVLHLIVSLLKIATPDSVDAKLDKFDAEATIFLNTLLATARSTVQAVDTLDFGAIPLEGQNRAKFDNVVGAVKATAAELGRTLTTGEAETIAQNGWALERKAGTVTA